MVIIKDTFTPAFSFQFLMNRVKSYCKNTTPDDGRKKGGQDNKTPYDENAECQQLKCNMKYLVCFKIS